MKQMVSVIKQHEYTHFSIDSVTINLNDNINYCKVAYYIIGDGYLDGGVVLLNSDEVSTWADDDDVLYNIVCNKLDYTLTNVSNE